MTLTDWLDRRGCLFLEWASAAFGDGERCGNGELLEDNSSLAGKSISPEAVASLPLLGREEGNRLEGSRDCLTQSASNWVRRRSFSSRNRFACSRSSATCLACFSCLASNSWHQRRNSSSGARFAGLLVIVLNSDGPVGGLGIAKALQIEGSPGAGVPKLLCTASVTSCLAFPTDGANCGLLISQSHWIVGAFTS